MKSPPVPNYTVVMVCPHVKYEDGMVHAPFEVHNLKEPRPIDGLDEKGKLYETQSQVYVCCPECTRDYGEDHFPVLHVGVWMGKFSEN